MFVVRTVRRGFFSDKAVLEAVDNGVLTRRWFGWDRLGALALRSGPWSIASGDVFALRVPKGAVKKHQTLAAADLEAFNSKPLARL